MMKANLTLPLAGLLTGGALSMFFSLLFLSWSVRTLGLALVLIVAALLLLQRGQNPLQGAMRFAAWFCLGFALSSALVSILDFVFPPLD